MLNYVKGGIYLEYLDLVSKDAAPRKLVGELKVKVKVKSAVGAFTALQPYGLLYS
jgi:hypothetical protein